MFNSPWGLSTLMISPEPPIALLSHHRLIGVPLTGFPTVMPLMIPTTECLWVTNHAVKDSQLLISEPYEQLKNLTILSAVCRSTPGATQGSKLIRIVDCCNAHRLNFGLCGCDPDPCSPSVPYLHPFSMVCTKRKHGSNLIAAYTPQCH